MRFADIPARANGSKALANWWNDLQAAGLGMETTISAVATTATAAGTTTLTAASANNQQFTGSTTQNVVLPTSTTLSPGRIFRIMNKSTGAVTVKLADGTTVLAIVNPISSLFFTLISSGTSNGTWDVDPASSGGGGGGSLQWIEDVNAPIASVQNHARVYLFTPGSGQVLYARVKVPSGYVTGGPIKLRTEFYTPDSTGTALVQAVATLIRTGTDAVSSTTNQRTSTNAALTLGAGTVNIPQAVTLDLSDTTGHINAVAVSPGDLILIALQLGSMTATSDVGVDVFAAETTYS